MRKERKHYSGEEKVAILRRHLLDKVRVSDLCEETGLRAGNAAVAGRCTASGRGLRGALQQGSPEQRHRLHHAEGRVGGPSAGDPRGTRPEAGSRQTAAPESPPASRLKSEAASRRDVGQACRPLASRSIQFRVGSI